MSPARIDSKDYIDELLYTIGRKDSLKAGILLRHIEEVDEKTQKRLVFELSRCDDDFSVPLLLSICAEHPETALRFPTLNRVLISKFLENREELICALNDPAKTPEHKMVLAEIAGEICCDEAVSALAELLKNRECPELIVVSLGALGKIGSSEGVNAVTELLYSEDRRIVVAAVEALKKTASPSAVKRLAEKLGEDHEIDKLIIDVFAVVQDETSLRKLNETLISYHAVIRNYGKSKLCQIGDKAVPMLIANLSEDDPDLLIHTLNVLGMIGDPSAVSPIRKMLFNEPADANVRFAAYEALGLLPLDKNSYILAAGLADPVDNVCIAAARAIDRSYNDILSAGIRNLLRDSNDSFHRIARTVIDSEADTIFLDLIGDDIFRKFALAYLKNKAHADVKEHFRKLLRKNRMADLADSVDSGREKKKPALRRVIVADDSKMILSVFRSALHVLGFESELFEKPAEALKRAAAAKPDLFITDLNMPEMTGIELASELRKLYSKEELPLLMVTTQHEAQDDDDALTAGVNVITHKPFTEESLGRVIAELLKGN